MDKFTFVLNFRLRDGKADPEQFLDRLFEAGCGDALVGVGQHGMIGFDFTREAATAEEALSSAISTVTDAIPGAFLVQVGPDLVGLSELAQIFNCTRQNLQKYVSDERRYCAADFPEPIFSGSLSLWHLAEIAYWLKQNSNLREPPSHVIAVSRVAAQKNLEIQQERMARLAALA